MSDDVLPSDVPGESTRIDVGDVSLHAVVAGPENGPPVVLLHGFPEFWYGWHEVVAPLASAGYRVIVPDQRGYNLSDRPEAVSAYHIDELAGDVVGLVDALGYDDVALAGHDWGGAVGWWVAMHYPEVLSAFVAVNIPHPSVFYRTIRRSWSQRLRSWYFLPFQLPAIPEAAARANDWWLVTRGMRESALPGTFTETDFARYRDAWSQPGAFTAMLNWYRANVRARPRPETESVSVPTLVCWGREDQFLRTEMAWQSRDVCEEGYLRIFDDATHWVQHEYPRKVADELSEFFD